MVLESSFDLGFGVLIGIFICMVIYVFSNYRRITSEEVLALKDTIFNLKKRNLDLEKQIINLEDYLIDFSKNPVYYKNTDGLGRLWIVNEEDHDKIKAFDQYMEKLIKTHEGNKKNE